LKTPFVSKKFRKQVAGCCVVCKENEPSLLDTHRIVHGGKYTFNNVCVCCVKCHRLHHAGRIKILGWCYSTKGRVFRWIDENGQEQITPKNN